MRDSEVKARPITAETSRATALLDFSAGIPLITGLARLVHVLAEADSPEYPALAPVGLDD